MRQTSPKGKKVEVHVKESDILIVAMKQGNAFGEKIVAACAGV
jgi:hypothetical protein